MALCTADEVRQQVAVSVYNENFGTGDGSTKVFYLKLEQEELYKKGLSLINQTEKIYVAGVLKTRTTDYTVDNESGKITFVAAPANLAALTADYEYCGLKRINATRLAVLIATATKFIESQTRMKFESTAVTSEKYDQPPGLTKLFLSHYPILTVTALTVDGVAVTVGKVYLQPNDNPMYLELDDDAEATDFSCSDPQGITISYTYGYSSSSTNPSISIPAELAKELCIKLVLLMCVNVNIYTIAWTSPGIVNFGAWQIDRGVFQTPGSEVIKSWYEEAKALLGILPKKAWVGGV